MINNRQAGRRRGRGGQQQRPQGNSGRPDNGNRIDNRSRGNAAQLLEKYKTLARDAQMSGDRVNTEYYLQFADHYFRVLAETRSRFEENRIPQQGGANTFQDDETEYDDDGAPIVAEQPSRQQSGGQQNGSQQNGYQGDRQNAGQQQDRQDRGDRMDRQGNERNERNERAPQDEDRSRRQNGNGAYGNEGERYVREDRGNRGDDRGNRTERYPEEPREEPPRRAAPNQAAAQETAPRAEDEPMQEAPRRRGRPRREPVVEAPAAFEADRLPPSLMLPATAPEAAPASDGDDVAAEEKPRRRRGRPPASEATSAN